MARRSPSRIQMVTSTTGNGPYTLANPGSPITGRRTIAEAVADGSLVNGDQVLFHIVDTAAAGSGKMMETGLGTINTSTLVLTVVSVYEKSAALTSGGGWGAGTRDVLISPPGAWNTAFIDIANLFTENQTISKTDPALDLSQGGVTRGRLIYQSNLLYLQYYSAGFVNQSQIALGNGTFEMYDGTTWRKVVRFVGGGVVKMTFNCTPPTGWTRINVTGERVAKYATASDSPEAQGGSWTISGLTTPGSSTQGYTLTVADIPSHTHEVFRFAAAGGTTGVAGGSGGLIAATNSGATGGDGSHAHGLSSMTVSSTGAWRPAYEIVVKASLD